MGYFLQKIQRQGGLSRRFSNVSYYGLTTPPYKLDALEPYMSKRTVELHWGKHHQDYMDGLNNQLATSPLYGYTLEDLIKKAYNNDNPLPEYNNTAQDDKLTYVTNFMDHLVSWHTVTLRMMRAESFVNLGEPNILEA
ncbi:superoxide dismutase [Fe] 2, chloroplastic-like isoform X1 [Zea mays]|uniref:superoxide dismutase [Fe] 2, chloroplastic-like isoform X1 n=1 Tax=Zea mays TaxID=4577 RepID=UPI0004DEC1E0|nr:superoxide dismutase [Fe] 2, chloroplastic-like isoform X1 [Zea mays]|eukprot:XP_008645012.1 superoxide dismutase [Fe] 2, chloroplastic-like isoform X1 [Zea mays]